MAGSSQLTIEWVAGSAVWQETARCRGCGEESRQEMVLLLHAAGHSDRWARCHCGTMNSLDLSQPPDYHEIERDDAFYMRIDQADSPDGVIDPTLRFAVPEYLAFVDLGCGVGFAADYFRFKGRTSIGYDPSSSALLARDLLGMPIKPITMVRSNNDGISSTFVLASEVIEHVSEPTQLIQDVSALAGPEGYVLLTTPDAEAVTPDESAAKVIAMLGPGQHLFLLTAGQLELMLRTAGFGFTKIWSADGRLFALAGHHPVKEAAGLDRADYREYLRQRASLDPGEDSWEYQVRVRCFGYRLYKDLVHAGKYREAQAVFQELSRVYELLGLHLQNPRDLLASYEGARRSDIAVPPPRDFPMSAPMICYLRGMELANSGGDFTEAVAYLRSALSLSYIYTGGTGASQLADLEIASLQVVVPKAFEDLGLDRIGTVSDGQPIKPRLRFRAGALKARLLGRLKA